MKQALVAVVLACFVAKASGDTVSPERSVKRATRAQLEAEVVKLRAENAKLREQLAAMQRAEEERIHRLREEQRKLDAKLK